MGKYNLRDSDVISGAVLAALGIYVMAQARAWNYYSSDGPGPGFFPTWYGLLMLALALALIAKTVIQAKPQQAGTLDRRGTTRALTTWLALVACVAAMGFLGFLLSFALFTFFLVAIIFRRSLVTAGVTALCTTLAFHLTFPVALGVQLPTGWLGF